MLGVVERRTLRSVCQGHGLWVLLQQFKDPDHAQARLGVPAVLVNLQCPGQLPCPFVVLAELEQQAGPAPLQPGIVCHVVQHRWQHGIHIASTFKLFATGIEMQITVNIGPAAQGP